MSRCLCVSLCQNHRAVLLIPDIYQRRCVRELVDLLLLRLGFAAVFVVQVTTNIFLINPFATQGAKTGLQNSSNASILASECLCQITHKADLSAFFTHLVFILATESGSLGSGY